MMSVLALGSTLQASTTRERGDTCITENSYALSFVSLFYVTSKYDTLVHRNYSSLGRGGKSTPLCATPRSTNGIP